LTSFLLYALNKKVNNIPEEKIGIGAYDQKIAESRQLVQNQTTQFDTMKEKLLLTSSKNNTQPLQCCWL
jgi:hypothetical protein